MRPHPAGLPVLAVALVAAVLGVQLANGGGNFEPTATADPCADRTINPVATGIEGLGEHLVLTGLDVAGCRLGVSRENLVLRLAAPGSRTAEELAAMRAGLLEAVDRLAAAGQLAEPATLADEALAEADLPWLLDRAVAALPDAVINAALDTDDVLRRAIEDLDLDRLLADLDQPAALSAQIEQAVTSAVRDALVDRVRGLLPG